MIKKWVKLLPYWIVMKLVRGFNASVGKFNKYNVNYYQIDEGEFVVFSKEVQEVFNKRRRERKKEKINKKKEKIQKMFDKDFSLKEEMKRDILAEEERDYNDGEYENEE